MMCSGLNERPDGDVSLGTHAKYLGECRGIGAPSSLVLGAMG